MTRSQLEHLLRAAGAILGERQFILIGSQSLHGKHADLPDEILVSMEADLMAEQAPRRMEALNVIGIDSPFHEAYGYYADPVSEDTAILPKGWKGRLVNLVTADGITALCLEPHDLAISKYAANRSKDRAFVRELARRAILDRATLLKLLRNTPVAAAQRAQIAQAIEADFAAPPTESVGT